MRKNKYRKNETVFGKKFQCKGEGGRILLLRIGCPVWIHISRKHLGILRLDSQRLKRISAPSLHVYARSRPLHTQHQIFPVQQHPGLHSNKLTAPWPQGPMDQDHLMTIGIRDADLILPQALKMNMREVPSYYGSRANSSTKGLRSGSIIFGKHPICQHTTSLSEFIAKQVPCRSGLFLNHEANVKTLLLDTKMMVFPMRLTVPFAASKQLLLSRQSRSIEEREIGKQFAPLWRVLADQLTILFPDGDDEGAFCRPSTRHPLTSPQH